MIDETVFRKMVSDSRIVTPENKYSMSKKIHGGIAIWYLHRTKMFQPGLLSSSAPSSVLQQNQIKRRVPALQITTILPSIGTLTQIFSTFIFQARTSIFLCAPL